MKRIDGMYDKDEIANVFVEYFEGMHKTSEPHNMELIFQTVDSRIVTDVNTSLVKVFTKEEIRMGLD